MSRRENTAQPRHRQNAVNAPAAAAELSLCAPKPDVSCFACCPPIRPPHYDPLDYSRFLQREFAENRRHFLQSGPHHRPIVGFSCWALGFLDSRRERIGCLLHPAQNQGEDLRHLVGYDAKCRRESCRPARVFAHLPSAEQAFWLELTSGLNSFYFSSRRANPLFHILGWGAKVLDQLHLEALANGWTATELLSHRPFVTAGQWKPQAHRWLFGLALERERREQSSPQSLQQVCEKLLREALAQAEALDQATTGAAAVFTHQLPLPTDFKDFIRLGLGRLKTTLERASQIERHLRRLLAELMD